MSSEEHNLENYSNKENVLEWTYHLFGTRRNGGTITDPWKIVDDHKRNNCVLSRKEKILRDSVTYFSEYNPKLIHRYATKTSKPVFTIAEEKINKKGEFKGGW